LLSISSGELLARGIVMKNEKLLQKDYLATYTYLKQVIKIIASWMNLIYIQKMLVRSCPASEPKITPPRT
jgi:hypothetical protein